MKIEKNTSGNWVYKYEEITTESMTENLREMFNYVDKRTEQEKLDDFWERMFIYAAEKGTTKQWIEAINNFAAYEH